MLMSECALLMQPFVLNLTWMLHLEEHVPVASFLHFSCMKHFFSCRCRQNSAAAFAVRALHCRVACVCGQLSLVWSIFVANIHLHWGTPCEHLTHGIGCLDSLVPTCGRAWWSCLQEAYSRASVLSCNSCTSKGKCLRLRPTVAKSPVAHVLKHVDANPQHTISFL